MADDATVGDTLVLSRAWIAAHVRPSDYFTAVSAAFLASARGELDVPAVGHVAAEGGGLHVKAAASRLAPRLAVVKVNANFPANPQRHGLPTIQGFVALFDMDNGRVLALLDSIEITARRTAAASLLAATHLADPAARSLAIVGCGVQGRCHLEAFAAHFPLAEVRCHDARRDRADALVGLAEGLGLAARSCAGVAACVEGAPLVVTCTSATAPILRDDHVAPGAFVAAVGADNPAKHELEPTLLQRARVVPDVLAQALAMGDLHHAVAAGAMHARDVHGELADVVAGRIAGRTRADERFVFDSTGTAIEDLAAASAVWAIAQGDPAAPRVPLGTAPR